MNLLYARMRIPLAKILIQKVGLSGVLLSLANRLRLSQLPCNNGPAPSFIGRYEIRRPSPPAHVQYAGDLVALRATTVPGLVEY